MDEAAVEQAPEVATLSCEQIAVMIGCRAETVRVWARLGRHDFPAPILRLGRFQRFAKADVLAWLEKRRPVETTHAS